MPDDVGGTVSEEAADDVCAKCLGAGGSYTSYCPMCQKSVTAWYEYLPGKEGPEHWPHPVGLDCGHRAICTLGFQPCPVCRNVNNVQPDL